VITLLQGRRLHSRDTGCRPYRALTFPTWAARAAAWPTSAASCSGAATARLFASHALVQRERTAHPLLVRPCGQEASPPRGRVRLWPDQVAERRVLAGDDLQQHLRDERGAWSFLFRSANRVESSLSPGVIVDDPASCDLPVAHHRRPQKPGFRQRHTDAERPD